MRALAYILLLIGWSAAWAQQPAQAPLQSFISGGAATGVHPSTTIPAHFSTFGQPFVMPRPAATVNGGGIGVASEFMFGAPFVTLLEPEDESPLVPGNGLVLMITFNEPIILMGGTIEIRRQSDNFPIQLLDGTDVYAEGNTLSIYPDALAEGEAVYIIITAGFVEDIAGNDFPGISDADTWNFIIEGDVSAPFVVSQSPVFNETGVPLNAVFTLTFNEPIVRSNGDILIVDNSDVVRKTLSNPHSDLIIDGNEMRIVDAQWPASEMLHVIIPFGAIKDVAGNSFDGYSNNTGWMFAMGDQADNTPPVLTARLPAPGATGIFTGTTLQATFDEPIVKGTGNVTIWRYADDFLLQSFAMTDPEVGVNGNILTVDVNGLPMGTQVYALIDLGAVKNLANFMFDEAQYKDSWSFTIQPDQQVPSLINMYPQVGVIGVFLSDALTLTFDEDMKKGTGNILVRRMFDDGLVQAIDVNSAEVDVLGDVVDINHLSFPPGQELYVTMAAGVFEDMAGNDFEGFSVPADWNFTTEGSPENISPFYTNLLPANNAVDVSVNSDLVITFIEDIAPGSGDIVIHRGTDLSVLMTIPIDDPSVKFTESYVTISHPDFGPGMPLYVMIAAGVITDLSGNDFLGITSTSAWNFTTVGTADFTVPGVLGLSPVNGAIDVALTDNLILTFVEDVVPGAGNLVIKKTSDNAVFESIDINGPNASVLGPVMTIDPSQTFEVGIGYYVTIDAGIVKDVSGNSYPGIGSTTDWAFTTVTVDGTPPGITDLTPDNGAVDVALTDNLMITFDEDVVAVSGNIVIKQTSDNQVFETIDINGPNAMILGPVLTIDPTLTFEASAGYYVTIAAGVIEDPSGNDFPGISSTTDWAFTAVTVDGTPPGLTDLTPDNGAVDVALTDNLVITFNEDVIPGNGDVVIKSSDDVLFESISIDGLNASVVGPLVTIDPTPSFVAGVSYYVTMAPGVIEDATGNDFPGFSSSSDWAFTAIAVDGTPPGITDLSPDNGAVDVALADNLIITFDEDVVPVTGDVVIKRSSDNTDFETIDINGPYVAIVGPVVTIDPSAPFESGVGYYVTIATGVVEDASGNDFIGISSSSDWAFTALDVTPPLMTDLAPDDDFNEVPLTANLVITFDEDVAPGIGSVVISKSLDDGLFESIDISNASIVGTVMTINPSLPFEPGVGYYVTMVAGVIEDMAGNDFAGIVSTTDWNFITTAPPHPDSFGPTSGSPGIALQPALEVTFDEPVQKAASGSIEIWEDGGVEPLYSIPIDDNRITIAGSKVTIFLGVDLDMLTKYYIIIPSGVLLDNMGNAFAGITDPTAWNFTTGDFAVPKLMDQAPQHNSGGAVISGDLVINFDESVQKGTTGTISIFRENDNYPFLPTIGLNDVDISSSDVTIHWSGSLPYSTRVYVVVTPGFFKDQYNNDFPGLAAGEWSFMTASDPTVPIITAVSPTSGNIGTSVTISGSGFDGTPVNNKVFFGTVSATVSAASSTQLTVTVPAGATYKPITVAVHGHVCNSGTPFKVSFPGLRPLSATTFETLDIVTDPGAAADLDFDDKVDVISQTSDTQISIYQNTTSLSAEIFSFATPITLTVPSSTHKQIAVGDLDGDGRIDLVVSNRQNSTVSVFRNEVSGSLIPAAFSLVAELFVVDVNGVKIEDMDLDGKGDIIACSFSEQSLAVFRNQTISTINFAPRVDFGITSNPYRVGIVDLNADGKPDMASPGYNGNTVSVLQNNSVPGIISFKPKVDFLSSDVSPSYAQHIEFGDLDNDNKLEIVVSNEADHAFSILRNVGQGGGDIASTYFDTYNRADVGNVARVLRMDDFDGDGKIDIGLGVGFSALLFRNTFATGISFSGGITLNNGFASEIIDVNRDGAPDIGMHQRNTSLDDLTGPTLVPGSPTSDPTSVQLQQFAQISVALEDLESGVESASFTQRTLGSTDPPSGGTLALTGGFWVGPTNSALSKDGGVEYWIQAVNTANIESVFGPFIIPLAADEGLIIPYSAFGHKKSNYRIVAVPLDLENKKVSDVFADDLGPRKDRKWRVARYAGGQTNQNFEGDIVPGQGYWLIVEKPGPTIDSGPGITIEATSANPKKIQLAADYTQIGNPYNFNLEWDKDVLGRLRVYRTGEYTDAETLNAMEGGFAFAASAGEISIPPIMTPITGREGKLHNPIDNPDWELYINVEQDELRNLISGVGMREHASPGYDHYDGMSMPRFNEYLELNHTGSVGNYHYSMDIVPTAQNHVWEFSVESSQKDGRLSFAWDNTYLGENSKELVLFDVATQRPVNMKVYAGYQFDTGSTNQFKVVFGDSEFVEENTQVNRAVIHQVYPNPAAEDLTVSLGIPKDDLVSIEVHDLFGRKLTTFFEGRLTKGHHEIAWDRAGDEPVGLYLIVAKSGDQVATARVILK